MASSKGKKILIWCWVLFSAPILLALGLIGSVWFFADIPSFEELERPNNKLATQVLAEDGEVLTTFHIENRSYVTYDELSPNLVNAAVATEDVRFYEHSGIDYRSLARVIFKTLLGGDSSQGGGSTITQQLAKTLYPRQEIESSIPGWSKVMMVWIKLKEWVTAVKLERSYTKEEIMNMYLNSVFFGSGAYGVQAASQTFFAKDPIDLTVEEAATLVGMVNKPTRYNPALNPDKSIVRRNFVIDQMSKAGYLSEAERDSIKNIPIVLSYQIQDHNSGLAPYFRDMLKRTMSAKKPKRSSYAHVEDFIVDSLQWENNPLYGWLNKNTKADGSNNFRIGKLSLGVYFTYSLGGKVYNLTELYLGTAHTAANKYRYMAEGWSLTNTESDIPSASSKDSYGSSRFVHDASYLRLKNVSLSYTFDLSKKVKWMRDITLSAYGENLWLLSKYNGYDPDVTGSGAVRRLDNAAYPNPRTYMISLKFRY